MKNHASLTKDPLRDISVHTSHDFVNSELGGLFFMGAANCIAHFESKVQFPSSRVNCILGLSVTPWLTTKMKLKPVNVMFLTFLLSETFATEEKQGELRDQMSAEVNLATALSNVIQQQVGLQSKKINDSLQATVG